MNWKNSLYILLSIFLFACGSSDKNGLDDNFEITGTIEGAGGKTLYLEALSSNGVIDVAQTKLEDDGTFELVGNVPAMGIYQLRLGEGEQNILPMTLSPDEKISLEVSIDKYMRRPVFKGAVWTEPLNQYMALFDDFANEQSLMAQQSNSMSQEEMMQAYLTLRKPLDEFAKNQMRKEPANPVNIILMSSLTPSMGWEFWDPSNLEILNHVAAAFNEKYKGSPIAEDMAGQQQQLSNSYQQFLAYKESQTTGGTVPEIELPTPEGKMLKLSSLRGKVVLIDFWASWCGPCRRENPNVVKMYNQYKNKGFTVFSVSLDENGEAWKKAIAMDGLLWPNHVSDLKGWNTPMTQLYGFNAIPHTVLIDANGKVIATNLRGQDLEQKLKEIL